MIYYDKSGHFWCDMEDIVSNPEYFLIEDGGILGLNPSWVIKRWIPKRAWPYLEQLLRYYSCGNDKRINLIDFLALLFVTCKCMSVINKQFSRKKKSFRTVFYFEDLFHTVLEKYFSFLNDGKTKQELLYDYDKGCYLESQILKDFFDFLHGYALERPCGLTAIFDSFVFGEEVTEDAMQRMSEEE